MKKTLSILIISVMVLATATAGTKWHNPMAGSIPMVSGRAWNSEIGTNSYNRMPDRLVPDMSTNVQRLQRQSAGLYIRFKTNSPKIHVRYTLTSSPTRHGNMAPLSHSAVDLYVYGKGNRCVWLPNQMAYKIEAKTGDTCWAKYDDTVLPVSDGRTLCYDLELPTYNGVKSVEIGVEDGSSFEFIAPSNEKPIVVYGSSIAQGAASSRPGNIWTSMLRRDMAMPLINLGFSGSALMEPEVWAALAEIDAKAYIIDCIPNSFKFADDGKTIQERYPAGIKKIRSHSSAPIIMAECIVATENEFVSQKDAKKLRANAILKKIYKQLVDEGIKNLYYVSAEDFGMTREGMVEGTHPNDIGMRLYANAYKKALKKAIK